MTLQLQEAALRWRKIKDLKEEIEARLVELLANPDATDEQVLRANPFIGADTKQGLQELVARLGRALEQQILHENMFKQGETA